jgi:colanic acid/amylovoran biosynthesis glycosyltransferase
MRLVIAAPKSSAYSETFIHAHIEHIPFEVLPLYGIRPYFFNHHGERIVFRQSLPSRLVRKMRHFRSPLDPDELLDLGLCQWFRQQSVAAVLAEYGTMATTIMRACELADIPLYVHFHGFDASIHSVLEEHKSSYAKLFSQAEAVIAVSKAMVVKLLQLGAPENRMHLIPYGIDPNLFYGADPRQSKPHFVAVGRFVEKKAPYLTVLAFAKVAQQHPEAHLTMVGDGPLLAPTRRLAQALHIDHQVTFSGVQPPDVVRDLMRQARALLQHSLVASDGDSEGTPLAVIEAQMCGLPVVATRHAGIPDVVLHGETGFLCEETDVDAMAGDILTMTEDPERAGAMGRAGRQRTLHLYSLDQQISKLANVLSSSRTARTSPSMN